MISKQIFLSDNQDLVKGKGGKEIIRINIYFGRGSER